MPYPNQVHHGDWKSLLRKQAGMPLNYSWHTELPGAARGCQGFRRRLHAYVTCPTERIFLCGALTHFMFRSVSSSTPEISVSFFISTTTLFPRMLCRQQPGSKDRMPRE